MQTLFSTPLCSARLKKTVGLCAFAASASLVWAQGPGVPTATVQTSAAARGSVLDGVIQAVKQSTVAAQTTGRIASFTVKAGDKVRAGQVLATIDDREAQVGMQHAQAQVNQADADLGNAQAQMERTRNLQAQGFVSKAALDTANAQYQSAKAQREQATASTRQSALAQSYTRVTAPLDGWVLQTYAQAGDLAVPGTPLLLVYAPQPLRAVVQVPASRSQAVRQAKQTAVLVESDQGGTLSIAPLNRLEVPSSDPVSQTIEWRLDLPVREAASLLPGQQVRVSFMGADGTALTSRLLVPPAAVVRRGELNAVYVTSGKGFVMRAVRLGREDAGGLEVLAGLRAGEVVATDPLRAAQVGASASTAK